MPRLILVRHAKSSWDDTPGRDDIDRPLSPRGRAGAEAVGRWLAERGHLPRSVLVSAARRTRETWESLARHLPQPQELRILPELYHAPPGTMLEALRQARFSPCLMVGHNPGIAAFAAAMLAERPDHPKFARYPTGATLVADLPGARWADVVPGTGRVVDFVVPKDLAAAG